MNKKEEYWLLTVEYKGGGPKQAFFKGRLSSYAAQYGEEEPILFSTPVTEKEYGKGDI